MEQRIAELENQLACAEDFLHAAMAALLALAQIVVDTATVDTNPATLAMAQSVLANFRRVFVRETDHK